MISTLPSLVRGANALTQLAAGVQDGEDDDTVTLRVNGKDFWGWTSVTITTSLEEVLTSFAVVVSGAYATKDGIIREDDDFELFVGDDHVATGVIDDVEWSGDGENASVNISGRSKVRDVVDCTVPTGSWSKLKLLKLLQTLVARYPIDVVDEAGLGDQVVPSHRAKAGEKLFDSIDRLKRAHRFIITDDARGRMVITQAGKAGTMRADRLVRSPGATNVLSGSVRRSCAERYSHIICQGQSINADDIDVDALGEARDLAVKRFRELTIDPEKGVSAKGAQACAIWEATTRAAKALECNYSVRGWRWADGTLRWKNWLAGVLDAYGRVDADLLVVSLTLTLTPDAGRLAQIRLLPPEAFTPQPTKSIDVSGYAYEAPDSTAPESSLDGEGDGGDGEGSDDE